MSSKDLVIVLAVISPAQWVGPSMELGFTNQVVIIGLSSYNVLVAITQVNLGRSLGLFVLEQHLLGNASLHWSVWSELNEDGAIVLAVIGPAQRIGPSVELRFTDQVSVIGLSLDNVLVGITQVDFGRSLGFLILEHHFIGNASLNESVWSQLNEDQIVIVTIIFPS